MNVCLQVVALSVIVGLLPEAIFQILKNRDIESYLSTPFGSYLRYDGDYVSFDDFVFHPRRMLRRYVIFRFVPPFIAFMLLSAILDLYFKNVNTWLPFLACAVVSILFRDITYILRAGILVRERISHFFVILGIAVLAAVCGIAREYLDFSQLAPQAPDLVTGVWGALLAASMVALYFTSIHDSGTAQMLEEHREGARARYALSAYAKIRDRLDEQFRRSACEHSCSLGLLYSVVIYEDMNRPSWLRKVENCLVRVPGISLTVGIAQVRSNRVLSDSESIYRAAEVLEGTDVPGGPSLVFTNEIVCSALLRYNDSKQYSDQVRSVGYALESVNEIWEYLVRDEVDWSGRRGWRERLMDSVGRLRLAMSVLRGR